MKDNDIFFEKEVVNDYFGRTKRTVTYKNSKYVLTARKYAKMKEFHDPLRIDNTVGYLIDCNGDITRDLSKAFVFEVASIIDRTDYLDAKRSNVYDDYEVEPKMSFYKNGLFIDVLLLEKAQQWLNDHPLPRKGISKMVRQNVYTKYNGCCAYCGCEMELKDMQVDHFIAHMSEGGVDSLDNYYPACEVCNRVKCNSSLDGFRSSIRHCGEIHRKRKKPIMADSDKIAIKYGLTEQDHDIEFYFEKYEKEPKLNIDKLKEMERILK